MSGRFSLLRRTWLVGWLALLAGLLLWPSISHAQPPEPHRLINQYSGAETCELCHKGITDEVVHSVHYGWQEKLNRYSALAGSISRINWLSILNEQLNIPGGCGRCHIGAGALPKLTPKVTAEDKAGIDCLICHSPNYDLGARYPVQTSDGHWVLTQDRSLAAARNAQRPQAQNCLRCHFNAGGGPLAKRGVDFAPVADRHAATSLGDVHADAGMSCVDCHRAPEHRILGYGPMIWDRDRPETRLSCQACHGAQPHPSPLLNQHQRVDCRTCHVPGTGGLVARDWTIAPEFDPVNELYSPVDELAEPGAIVPEYRWYNGAPVKPDQPWPGKRDDETARIQPFKQLLVTVPVDAASGEPIPLKLDIYYREGNLEQAIEEGAREAGMHYSGAWQPRQVSVFYQISHGVVGKEQALSCQACHVSEGRVDFASLGYAADEVALLTTISAPGAGPRRPLRLEVILPPPEPLPTPILASQSVEAVPSNPLSLPWDPLWVSLTSAVIVVVTGIWLWRQRPR